MSNYAIRETTGAPTNGTTAVFTLTRTSTVSGTFRLGAGSRITAPIAHDADAATIQAALRALPTIGSPNVTVSGDTSPTVITMAGNKVKTDFGPIYVANNSTAGTVSIAETTPGVTASARTAPFGALLVRSDTGAVYRNTSTTANAPTWTKITDLATIAAVATADADGTYGSAEADLINELKTKYNTLLAELKTAGIVASS